MNIKTQTQIFLLCLKWSILCHKSENFVLSFHVCTWKFACIYKITKNWNKINFSQIKSWSIVLLIHVFLFHYFICNLFKKRKQNKYLNFWDVWLFRWKRRNFLNLWLIGTWKCRWSAVKWPTPLVEGRAWRFLVFPFWRRLTLGTSSVDWSVRWASTCCWALVPEITGCKKPEMKGPTLFLPPVFGSVPVRILWGTCSWPDLHNDWLSLVTLTEGVLLWRAENTLPLVWILPLYLNPRKARPAKTFADGLPQVDFRQHDVHLWHCGHKDSDLHSKQPWHTLFLPDFDWGLCLSFATTWLHTVQEKHFSIQSEFCLITKNKGGLTSVKTKMHTQLDKLLSANWAGCPNIRHQPLYTWLMWSS